MSEASKKDKRRQQIGARLSKLESTFGDDRSTFYRSMLHNLSTSLAAIQQGTHEEYLSKRHELESARDYELTRLRLWEEYQVKRVETEYKEDIAVAKQTYDMMVKLLKEKFYDKLQRQVKQLKEDKLLLNLINASSWSPNGNDATVSALSAAAAASSLTLHDRRSLRKRDLHSRFASGEADDLSESNMSGGSGLRTGSGSAGYISASGKRRRHYATRYSSNDESSGVGGANGMKSAGTASSGNDSNLSDKDYDALNQMIMNNDEGVPSMFGARPRPARGSHKQFVGVQGLRPDELNSDLTLLRNAVKRER